MIYLEKIKIVSKTYPGSHVLKTGFEFNCSDVNIFVGNQGCGKSTILDLIQKNHKDIEVTLSENTIKNGVNTFYFDSEKDNPRMKDPQLFTKPNGENVGYGYGNALMSRFKSHGEILETIVIEPILKAKNCVIILDEPMRFVSENYQEKASQMLKEISQRLNIQFIIITHNQVLASYADRVFESRIKKGITKINQL